MHKKAAREEKHVRWPETKVCKNVVNCCLQEKNCLFASPSMSSLIFIPHVWNRRRLLVRVGSLNQTFHKTKAFGMAFERSAEIHHGRGFFWTAKCELKKVRVQFAVTCSVYRTSNNWRRKERLSATISPNPVPCSGCLSSFTSSGAGSVKIPG